MARALVAMENSIAGTGTLNIAVSALVFVVCVTILIGLCTGFAPHKILHDDSELDAEKLKLRNAGETFSSNLLIKRSSLRSMFSRSNNETSDNANDGGAVWQRPILRGERCKPLSFSGLVLYDEKGNRLPETK
ncbi:uncharacterized protein [Physcomitrium patens]|uniref:Uncharacterized protein n=1 Tax=Physcomitrium patens TaxID=3218 RepID=A9RJL9_PHYPA|nr:uncharacterized protein LOC112281777 [Physcomitrium patens]PNR55512.1 hypothetical protein PHYPA_006409 [Physcomitrium patens]|eukprot:XP_024374421.1 uncharacterized protein LOC112281777 [Physcomitrella patens]